MPRRGENIYKRRDGRRDGRYIAEYDAAGKAKYRAVYARSCNEVKQKLLNAKTNNSARPHLSPATVHDIFIFFRTGVQCANKNLSMAIKMDDVILPKYTARSFRVFSKAEQQRIENAVTSYTDAPNYNRRQIFGQ